MLCMDRGSALNARVREDRAVVCRLLSVSKCILPLSIRYEVVRSDWGTFGYFWWAEEHSALLGCAEMHLALLGCTKVCSATEMRSAGFVCQSAFSQFSNCRRNSGPPKCALLNTYIANIHMDCTYLSLYEDMATSVAWYFRHNQHWYHKQLADNDTKIEN